MSRSSSDGCEPDVRHGALVGLDDPALGEGTPLSELAEGRHRLPPELSGHWVATAPGRIARCARGLIDGGRAGNESARVFLVPGRIEVLGKHTDYAGGGSLLAAVERGFVLIALPRPDRVLRVHALDAGESSEFPIAADLSPSPGWPTYPMTVARRLARDFPGIAPGAEIALQSDLPLASGMSSSSALLVGTFLCLASVSGLARDQRFREAIRNEEELATYLAAVESGQGYAGLAGDAGVGTHGGSEDHTAILNARPGRLLHYRFIPTRMERAVDLPAGYRFAIACSGVAAEKTGAMRESYNRASALVRALLEVWRQAGGEPATSLASALRSEPDALERLRTAVGEVRHPIFEAADLHARLEHFVRESSMIVPTATVALSEGRLTDFGSLVDESQRLAEQLLVNQIPETTELARSARRLGAAAASAFGAGYGGSVWALVEEATCEEFLREWRHAYGAAFPGPAALASFFGSSAGPAARRLA